MHNADCKYTLFAQCRYLQFWNVSGLHNCLDIYIPLTILSFQKPELASFKSDLSHWHLLALAFARKRTNKRSHDQTVKEAEKTS